MQEIHYDPWGLPLRGIERTNNHASKVTYTGKELQSELNLSWYDFGARFYDMQLGRWHNIDPALQYYSPYLALGNNPMNGVDKDGRFFGTVLTAIVDFFRVGLTKGGFEFWNANKKYVQNAWVNYDPTRLGSRTNNAFRIDMGLFKADANKGFGGNFLQIFSRLTWELPQTVLGNAFSHTRNLLGVIDNVDYYGGATLVNNNVEEDNGWWGATLGSYINSKNMVADPYRDEGFRHEYGHTIQSRLTGPLYFPNVALPSLSSSIFDAIGWHDHDVSWFETQANRMAFRYFRKNEPNSLIFNPKTQRGRPWDSLEYPTEYNPDWTWTLFHPPLPFIWWLLF